MPSILNQLLSPPNPYQYGIFIKHNAEKNTQSIYVVFKYLSGKNILKC